MRHARRITHAARAQGHKIKNPATQLSARVRELPRAVAVILSGTPIQNNVGEMHALFDFTTPVCVRVRVRVLCLRVLLCVCVCCMRVCVRHRPQSRSARTHTCARTAHTRHGAGPARRRAVFQGRV